MVRPTPGKTVLLSFLGAAVLFLVAWKVVVALRSDEERVRLVLEDVFREARELDAGAVLEYLDPEYSDGRGLTAAEFRLIVIGTFRRATALRADYEIISPVAVTGDTARVVVAASVEVELPGETHTLPDAGYGAEAFELELRRHGSYFRLRGVRSAESAEADGTGD